MNEEQFKKLHNLYRNLPPAQFLDLTIIQCAKVALHFNEKKTCKFLLHTVEKNLRGKT